MRNISRVLHVFVYAILVVLFGGYLNTVSAIDPPSTEWEKTFGGTEEDVGLLVQETSDGSFIIAGRTYSFGVKGDIYLIKTDASGNELWSKTFGGTEDDRGSSVQETSDGGFIIVGHTRSFGAGKSDVYLIKTDASGNELWTKTFGGAAGESGLSVQETSDGGFVIAGRTSSFGAGKSDVYLIKTDASGNELWTKVFGGADADSGNSVQETSDGGFVITGRTSSFGAGDSDVYLIKTNAGGNELWSMTFGGTEDDSGNSVQETSDGGIVIAGRTMSFGVNGDVYLIKTDASGNELWSKTFGGTEDDIGNSVQETSDGGFVIVGGASFTDSFNELQNDGYVIKTDAGGNELWSMTFGGTEDDSGNSVQETSDGGIVIAGNTKSFGSGGDDVYLIKLAGMALMPPKPEVKVNGVDGPIAVNTGINLSVTIELDPGDKAGEDADWWVYAASPFGTYWYMLNAGWQPSNTPIRLHGGPLFNLSPHTVLNMSTLPVGDYNFNFEVDDNMDNIKDGTYTDAVDVTIE